MRLGVKHPAAAAAQTNDTGSLKDRHIHHTSLRMIKAQLPLQELFEAQRRGTISQFLAYPWVKLVPTFKVLEHAAIQVWMRRCYHGTIVPMWLRDTYEQDRPFSVARLSLHATCKWYQWIVADQSGTHMLKVSCHFILSEPYIHTRPKLRTLLETCQSMGVRLAGSSVW